jgi:hypothetical protein
MNYGEILSKAWKTIWKHKILWLFGILAGCSASVSGSPGAGGTSATSSGTNARLNPESLDFLTPSFQQKLMDFGDFLGRIPVVVWVLIILGLVLFVFIISLATFLLGTFGETGAIAGTSLADQAGDDAPGLSFKAVISALKPHYWKIVLLRLGINLASFIITLIIMIPLIVLITCTCCLGLFLMIPIGWLVRTMVLFTMIAIIEEGLGIFPAISRAWKLITRNLVHVLVMFLILSFGGWIVGLIISLPFIITFLPLIINLLVVMGSGSGSILAGLIISLLLIILASPIAIVLRGVLRTYILAAWTLTYRRLVLNDELKPQILETTSAES